MGQLLPFRQGPRGPTPPSPISMHHLAPAASLSQTPREVLASPPHRQENSPREVMQLGLSEATETCLDQKPASDAITSRGWGKERMKASAEKRPRDKREGGSPGPTGEAIRVLTSQHLHLGPPAARIAPHSFGGFCLRRDIPLFLILNIKLLKR